MSHARGVEFFFSIGWAAFWLYWLGAATSAKKGRASLSGPLRVRAVLVVLVILLVRVGVFRNHGLNSDPLCAGIGIVLFVLGVALAIWARLHIGRNRGTRCPRN